MSPDNHYHILGIPSTASIKEIKRAYRTLALQYHPDINDDPNAARYFLKIQEAYKILLNADTRKKYDYFLFSHSLEKKPLVIGTEAAFFAELHKIKKYVKNQPAWFVSYDYVYAHLSALLQSSYAILTDHATVELRKKNFSQFIALVFILPLADIKKLACLIEQHFYTAEEKIEWKKKYKAKIIQEKWKANLPWVLLILSIIIVYRLMH